jgi:hypothetical protein
MVIISYDQRGYEAHVAKVVDLDDRSIFTESGLHASIELALRVLLHMSAQTVRMHLHPTRDIYGGVRLPNGEDRIEPGR